MKVILADTLGMCFGVRDALKVIDAIDTPEEVTIHGELVHNEAVIDRLRTRGFQMLDERKRIALPQTETVLITAHGISNTERARLRNSGRKLLDTTCPLVTRAHDAAQSLQRDGYHVLVIGKRGHVEVEGIVGDLDSFDILQSAEDVRTFPNRRLGIMCQTTTPATLVEQLRELIAEHNPQAEIRFIDTVCHPTKSHQEALQRLLDQVQAVVVVGGKNSNNTRQLVRSCQKRGVPAYHVQAAEHLRREWFKGIEEVGLTAGTSTLDETISAVHQALLCI